MADNDVSIALSTFEFECFRLETFQQYPGPDPRYQAWVSGQPLPPRNPVTNPYMRWLAQAVLAGKRWSRCHIVDTPLTDYLEYELVSYRESAAVGEEILITPATVGNVGLVRDYWLFDWSHPHLARAVVMDYSPAGEYRGTCATSDPDVIARCVADRETALAGSVPLHVYLAGMNRDHAAA